MNYNLLLIYEEKKYMSTRKITSFPIQGINNGITNIMYSIAEFVKTAFPPNFFKFEFVDTQNGLRQYYYNMRTKKLEPFKIEMPKLIVTYNLDNFDTSDTGLGENPLRQYPSHYISTEMRGYNIFYKDNYGIELYTSDIRIKTEFEVIIELGSRSDQLSTGAYLNNFIRFLYGYRFGDVKTSFILPNYLIAFMKRLIYKNTVLDEDGEKMFDQHLKTFSANSIIAVNYDGNKQKEKFYKLEREYNTIYVQFTNKPTYGNQKRGEVYDKFTITFSGFIEFYIPIAVIVNIPDIIAGEYISSIVLNSIDTDKRLNAHATTMITSHEDSLVRPLVDPVDMELVHFEEFALENSEDEFNLIDWVPKAEKDLIKILKNLDEFYNLYELKLYCGDYLLTKNVEYTLDEKFNLKFINGKIEKIYTLELYRSRSESVLFYDRLRRYKKLQEE